jgi:hypothetical protein
MMRVFTGCLVSTCFTEIYKGKLLPGFNKASGPGRSDILMSPTCVGTSAVATETRI